MKTNQVGAPAKPAPTRCPRSHGDSNTWISCWATRCWQPIPAFLVLCACGCITDQSGSPQTYAGLEAEVSRNAARFERSQLTRNPEQNLDSSELTFSLFFQLPLSERVVYIMDSFARVELDGEYAERMYAMLCNLRKPKAWWETPSPPTAEDEAYTRAIFRTIESYRESQLRSFCREAGSYARFQKNLQTWKERCKIRSSPIHSSKAACKPRIRRQFVTKL